MSKALFFYADPSTEQPSKKVPTQPNCKRKRSEATHSEQKKHPQAPKAVQLELKILLRFRLPNREKKSQPPTSSRSESAFLQSPINTPTHDLDGSQDPAATPSHVTATKKYIWMPSESESEPEFKGGRKLWKKHPNWTEEEKRAMYRIFI